MCRKKGRMKLKEDEKGCFWPDILSRNEFIDNDYCLIKRNWNLRWPWVKNSFNPFSPRQLSISNFSLHNICKIKQLVMRNCELIKQSKVLKIKIKILINLFNDKSGLKLGEFNNTSGIERVKKMLAMHVIWVSGVITNQLSYREPAICKQVIVSGFRNVIWRWLRSYRGY